MGRRLRRRWTRRTARGIVHRDLKAAEHHADGLWRKAAGLRAGKAGLIACGPGCNDGNGGRVADYGAGDDSRDVSVHVAGAGGGPRAGWSKRHLSRIGFVHEFRPLDRSSAATARKALDAGWRHASGRTTSPGDSSVPHKNDRRKLQALDSTSHTDRAGSDRQRSLPGLDRGGRGGAGKPRYRARMMPTTPSNSETLRQIAIEATGVRPRVVIAIGRRSCRFDQRR
jgi:hypothetical protein